MVPPRSVVGADHKQAGILALGAGVRLERDRVESGDLGEPLLKLAEHDGVSLCLGDGDEGMEAADLLPGDGKHLGGGVQLHGAGAERDHRGGEREILRLEAAEVSEHPGLGVVGVEDGMGQDRRGAAEADRKLPGVRVVRFGGGAGPEECNEGFHREEGLVERDGDHGVAEEAEIDPGLLRAGAERGGLGRGDLDADGVEERGGGDLPSRLGERCGELEGTEVDLLGNLTESLGAVIDRVHGGDDGEQDLGGADVAGRLLAADVLFAGLEREAVGGIPVGIARDADEAAGKAPLELVTDGEEGGMGSSVAHRDAKALGRSDHGIGPELTGRLEDDKGQRITRHDGKSAARVDRVDHRLRVGDGAVGGGVLKDSSTEV